MVFEVLQSMLAEVLGCNEGEITLNADLRDDLGLSDDQLAEVMEAMAGELGFRYEENGPEEVYTVAELVRYIAGLL